MTGSGKTFTFFGPESTVESDLASGTSFEPSANTGIVLRTCVELLAAKERMAKNGVLVSYTAQFVEIYEEQVN